MQDISEGANMVRELAGSERPPTEIARVAKRYAPPEGDLGLGLECIRSIRSEGDEHSGDGTYGHIRDLGV